AQEKVVSGTVLDEQNLPVPGVNIIVRGTQRSVQTDTDGRYSISASQGEVLEFSFVGYKTQSMAVGASNTINISMQPDERMIEELVIDTYRSTTQAKNPSAVTTLSIETIEDRANPSLLQNLQGTVAGLNIATGSGQPGS